MKGGEHINKFETVKYIGSLFHALTDGLGDMTKTDEYRKFIKQNTAFNYPPDVMAKIKAHNPAFTKVTTSGTWDSTFGRTIKKGEKPFRLEIANNQPRHLYDISQTVGKPPVSLYQNISGKVEHYQLIVDCLTKLSPAPVEFQTGAGYYSGIGQDSFIQDGKIILRPALSEQQAVFALIREIARHNQTSAVVVEAVSYMVCKHLKIDTSVFTFGYLLELTGFDESLNALRDRTVQDTINKEAEIFIGYLNAKLSFPQDDTGETGGEAIEAQAKPAKAKTSATAAPHADKTAPVTATAVSRTVEVHTEKISDIDFRFIKIIREFSSTLPDKSINLQSVKDYGYYDTKMHPVSFNVAARLLTTGREVFKLHKDNTEQRINTIEEAKKHSGYFGISKDEWATAQVQILKEGVDGATSGINRWSKVISPEAVQEARKRKMEKEKLEAQKSAQAQPAAADNQDFDESNLVFDENGALVIVENDISYSAIENQKWLESALPVFFKQTGFRQADMPYFVNITGRKDCEDIIITPEMKKINALMGYYCSDYISRVLNHERYKKKNSETGKTEYKVKAAVSLVCGNYSVIHIQHALNEFRANIKAPMAIKMAFEKCLALMKKKLAAKPRRETPDESIRRVKLSDEANAGATHAEQDGTPNSKAVNEQNAEIRYIIDSYKKNKASKPKKSANDLPVLPPIAKTAR